MQTAIYPAEGTGEVKRIGSYRRSPEDIVIDLDAFLKERDCRDSWLIDDKVLPDWVEVQQLCYYLQVTDKTLSAYRTIAYRYVPDYTSSCNARYPEFQQDLDLQLAKQLLGVRVCPVQPDRPPFTSLEAYILCAIAHLFKQFKKRKRRDRSKMVVELIQKKNHEGFPHWYTALGLPIELPKG